MAENMNNQMNEENLPQAESIQKKNKRYQNLKELIIHQRNISNYKIFFNIIKKFSTETLLFFNHFYKFSAFRNVFLTEFGYHIGAVADLMTGIAYNYAINGMGLIYRDLVTKNNKDFASAVKSKEKAGLKQLEKVLDVFRGIEG